MNQQSEESAVVSKVMWRLIPFMTLLYLFNYLDRANINTAKLQMVDDKSLNMDDAVYGYGAAIFFWGYFLFEVPSNIFMEKVGARVWIARIMISWGIVSTAFVFVQGPISFYALRFLLGVAEAGFFPGMLLYLTYWIPASDRAKVISLFMGSIPLATVVGSPLNGMIMSKMDGTLDMPGWKWVFLLEGIPTVLLGISVYFYLTDKPEDANWLTEREKATLLNRLHGDRSGGNAGKHKHHWMEGMNNWRVWALSLVYMSLMFGFYFLNYWSATVLKETYLYDNPDIFVMYGPKNSDVNLIVSIYNALPFLGAVLGMVLIGRLYDKSPNRKWVLACAQLSGVTGMLGLIFFHGFESSLFFLTLAAVGIMGSLAPFWTLPPAFLAGSAAAAGIAFINSWGNLGGGYVGNSLTGYFIKAAHEPFAYKYGLMVDAVALLAGTILTWVIHTESTAQPNQKTAE